MDFLNYFRNSVILKISFLLIFVVLYPQTLSAQRSLKPDDLCGEWWTPENDGKIIFFKSNGKYYGKVSWIKNPIDPETGKPRLDKKNPDPNLRSRTIMNLILFYDFEYNSTKDKYINGKLYDSNTGNTYACWIKLINFNVLELHGYVGLSVIGKSVYFPVFRNNYCFFLSDNNKRVIQNPVFRYDCY